VSLVPQIEIDRSPETGPLHGHGGSSVSVVTRILVVVRFHSRKGARTSSGTHGHATTAILDLQTTCCSETSLDSENYLALLGLPLHADVL
jgi:hypothetical protein